MNITKFEKVDKIMSLNLHIEGGSFQNSPGTVFDKKLGKIGTISISGQKRYFSFDYRKFHVDHLVDITHIFYHPDFTKRMENILSNLLVFKIN